MTTEKLTEAKRLEEVAALNNGQFKEIKARIEILDQMEALHERYKEQRWYDSNKIDGLYFTPAFARRIYEQMLDYCEKTALEAELALELL